MFKTVASSALGQTSPPRKVALVMLYFQALSNRLAHAGFHATVD
jgi:hypothetical protein